MLPSHTVPLIYHGEVPEEWTIEETNLCAAPKQPFLYPC